MFGATSEIVFRYMLGLPGIVSTLVVILGCGLFFAWINGDIKRGQANVKAYEKKEESGESEERVRISKLYDESLKRKSR